MRLKSRATIILTHIKGLITLLITTHEPPSRVRQLLFETKASELWPRVDQGSKYVPEDDICASGPGPEDFGRPWPTRFMGSMKDGGSSTSGIMISRLVRMLQQ